MTTGQKLGVPMFKASAQFDEGVESFKGNVATDDGKVALARACKALIDEYGDDLVHMRRFSVKRFVPDAKDSFRRVQSKKGASGENGAQGAEGNAGVAARQAATREKKGKGARA